MTTPSHTLLFLTYIPRADVDERGYEPWVRDIDNAFFNAVPGIAHYSNWKVAQPLLGRTEFSHFDLLFLEKPDGFAEVFGREEVSQFAHAWVDRWGAAPESPTLADNCQFQRMAEIAVPREGFACDASLVVATSRRPDGIDPAAYEQWLAGTAQPAIAGLPGVRFAGFWRCAEPLIATIDATDVAVILLDSPAVAAAADSGLAAVVADWSEQWGASVQLALASLIGAPGVGSSPAR